MVTDNKNYRLHLLVWFSKVDSTAESTTLICVLGNITKRFLKLSILYMTSLSFVLNSSFSNVSNLLLLQYFFYIDPSDDLLNRNVYLLQINVLI